MTPTLQQITTIVLSVYPTAERILLFGSRAAGNHRVDSDYDLLVVSPTRLRPARRGAALRLALRQIDASFDIVVVTPEEFREMSTMRSSVVSTAISQGRTLHEVA